MDDRYYIRNRIMEACPWSGSACLSVDLNSGYSEHKPHLSLILWRLYLLFRLPKWVLFPCRRKVLAQTWDAATVARMGRDWYWDETRRELGISLAFDGLRIKYGRQPDCWPGNKSWSLQFSWWQTRLHRHSYYGLQGEHVATLLESDRHKHANWLDQHAHEEAVKETVPKAVFELEDFDGTRIRCTTLIEEREWRRGNGPLKWLSAIFPSMVSRSLSMDFDKEVGYEKGSWKGGMTGSGIDVLPGELHEAALRRYCANGVRNKNGISKLTVIGAA